MTDNDNKNNFSVMSDLTDLNLREYSNYLIRLNSRIDEKKSEEGQHFIPFILMGGVYQHCS